MAIPPIRPYSHSQGPTSPEPLPGASEPGLSASELTPVQIGEVIEAAMQEAAQARNAKLAQLSVEIRAQVEGFEQFLMNNFQEAALTHARLEKEAFRPGSNLSSHSSAELSNPDSPLGNSRRSSPADSGFPSASGVRAGRADSGGSSISSGSTDISVRLSDSAELIHGLIDNCASAFPNLPICKDWFSMCWSLGKPDLGGQLPSDEEINRSILFLKEQILNRCVNGCFFNDHANRILERNKGALINWASQGALSIADIREAAIGLITPSSERESHVRGRVPMEAQLEVQLTNGENLFFSLYFKPRDARVDEAVIRAFQYLNNDLTPVEKSSQARLPYLVIWNEDSLPFPISMWECVPGKPDKGKRCAERVVAEVVNPKEKGILTEQLHYLEAVCKYLGVSDLHYENIIFIDLGTDHPKIYAVDLESMQPGNATGLMERSSTTVIPELTAAERNVLDQCKAHLFTLPVRYVPLPTALFLGALQDPRSFVEIAKDLIHKAVSDGYQLSVSIDELRSLVLLDVINNDVPCLVILGDDVFYVAEDGNKMIAHKGR